MSEPVDPLTLQFLAWVASRPRSYTEAMEAWQTTCPRHTVWEDALIDGLVQVQSKDRADKFEVILTPKGRTLLDEGNHKSSAIDVASRA